MGLQSGIRTVRLEMCHGLFRVRWLWKRLFLKGKIAFTACKYSVFLWFLCFDVPKSDNLEASVGRKCQLCSSCFKGKCGCVWNDASVLMCRYSFAGGGQRGLGSACARPFSIAFPNRQYTKGRSLSPCSEEDFCQCLWDAKRHPVCQVSKRIYLTMVFLPLMMYTPFGRRAALPFIRMDCREIHSAPIARDWYVGLCPYPQDAPLFSGTLFWQNWRHRRCRCLPFLCQNYFVMLRTNSL